jgi:signal transduction histidine kinase
VEEISSSALQMGDDMNDIIWAINPHNDSFESIVNRLRNYASRMAESKNIALDFSAEENLLRENLPMGKRKNLYLICKEAVNNSVKYSGCKNLSIAFHKHKMYMHISVSDDGKGFDTQNNFEGNGLKNMKQRAQQMGSGFSIQSSPGSGVQIIIDIPNA